MNNEQKSADSIDIEYNAAIEMVKKEKLVRVELVNQVVSGLIRDAKTDEEDNSSYENSTRKKLYDMAEFFLDESMCYEGSKESFHNLAVDFAGQDMFSEACNILERGLSLLPAAVDLLADYLLYGSRIPARRIKCKYYYEKLKAITKKRWNWRAYSFSIRYLLNEQNYVATADEDEQVKNEVISIGKEYVRKFGGKNLNPEYIDRAYSDLADIYSSYGAYSKAFDTLKECVDKYNKTPIASFYLAEKEFDSGNYIDASGYLSDCISHMEIRSPVNKGYVFLLRAYSDVSILLSNDADSESSLIRDDQKKELLSRLHNDIDTAHELMSDRRYESAIESLWTIIDKQFDTDEEYRSEYWK